MRRSAFSLVEIVLALSIASAIAAISITYYREYQEDGMRAAIIQDLDALRRAIELYETQTRRAYQKKTPPVGMGISFRGKLTDAWGNPYTVLPERSIVYSFGPNGVDDEGTVDDIILEYSSLGAGVPLRAPRQLVAQRVWSACIALLATTLWKSHSQRLPRGKTIG